MAAVSDEKTKDDEEDTDGLPRLIDALPPHNKGRLQSYYSFEPIEISNAQTTDVDGLLSMNIILDEFVQFLPIFTLSNFIRSFPDYEYDALPIMKAVYEYEATLDYSKLRDGNWWETTKVDNIDTDDVVSLIEPKDVSCGYIDQDIELHKTTVRNMAELIQLVKGSQQRYNYGLEGVNKTIGMADSIGLGDLLSLNANYDAKSTNHQTSKMVLGFLMICLPLNGTADYVVYRCYEYRRTWGGASASDDDISKTWTFAFEFEKGKVRKVSQRWSR